MAQAVFATKEIERGVTTWHGLPETIILPPINLSGRKDYSEDDIASLAHDIATHGQDTPVKIRKNDQGQPVLVFGRRRYLAVQYANKHKLGKKGPIELWATYEANMTEEDALIAAIRENWERKGVSDADHAHNIGELLKFGKKSIEAVAKIYFPAAKSPAELADALRWVRVRGQIDQELADEGKKAMREGVLTTTAASELAKLPKDTQREVIAEAKTNPAKTVKGKARIKVSDVKKAKPASKPKPPAKAKSPDPKDVAFDVPAHGPVSLPSLPSNPVLAAAEVMARAAEAWETDATPVAEKAMLGAVRAYRALVPLRSKAA